jgi:Holliday junction resolvase RusA-like endonuclease
MSVQKKRKPKPVKMMSPMEVRDIDTLCKMPRDNLTVGDFWILTDGYTVTICQQKTGHSPTEKVHVPRATFNRMVRWYTKPVKVKP